MNKRVLEFLNGIGLVLSAFAMMFVAAGILFLIFKIYRIFFK